MKRGAGRAPNVVVIIADDLGFSDLSCFGGEIETPALDRLAREGVRMSTFYVTPRCSPSRAALLTGRHPHSVGIGILTSDDRPNGYPGSLSGDVPTIATRLRELGYATALVGKWHLSSDTTTPDESWPTRRGFDEFYGILPGAASYFQPPLVEGERRLPVDELPDEYYLTDDLSRRAVDFVERAAAQGKPFLLSLAYTAPHWPLHAHEPDIARYRERYAAGWDALREQRFARLEAEGLTRMGTLPPRDPTVPAWEDASDHGWELERMSVYAAQVEAMDRGIAAVVDRLEALGIRDDTLVVFTSDNGACDEALPFPASRLSDAACPPVTRDGRVVSVGNEPAIMPGSEESYGSYGRAWAHLSNTPFRRYKRWVHEGGISSPLIASWPAGGVTGGRLVDAPAHVVDIAPSVLDAVGAPAAFPGTSLIASWRGLPDEPRDLYWEHMGNAAVRRGPWKLVREALAPWELYDVESDRGETADLATRRPDLVAELEAAWLAWARANGVIPWEAVLADFRARGRSLPGMPTRDGGAT